MRPHIPSALATDKSVVILVTRWRNLLEEHRLCRQRVNWKRSDASIVECRRRKRRWEVESKLNAVEHALISFCADATQHHEIYTRPIVQGDPLDRRSFSQYDTLLREYYQHLREVGAVRTRNVDRQKRTRKRRTIIQDITALKWRWLSALFRSVFPTLRLPPKRVTDYRVLRPKRLAKL